MFFFFYISIGFVTFLFLWENKSKEVAVLLKSLQQGLVYLFQHENIPLFY